MFRRILITLFLTCLLTIGASVTALAVTKNINNDGFDDVFITYRYDNAATGAWAFTSDGSLFNPTLIWASGNGAWESARSTPAMGNFSGDARADLAILYDYGNASSAIWVFETTDTGYVSRLAWASGAGCWDASRSKLASGNFSGSDYDDLAVLYDYGGATTRAWILESDGTNLTSRLAWASGAGCWDASHSKLASGNFSGSDYDDLAVLYDYGGATTRAWILESDGTNLTSRLAWASGVGCWAWTGTKIPGGERFIPRYGLAIRKSIDINLSAQTLYCYENSLAEVDEGVYAWIGSAVFSTLVSSGRSPFNTPTGSFAVYAKDPVVDMSGFGGTSEYYYVPNVPYVLWFTGNYSIHGAYWHNDFGNVRSHGCVNTPVGAAAWIYGWAPIGTPVYVHY